MWFGNRPEGRTLERSGQVFFVVLLATLLAAWNSGVSLYYLLFGGMASFVIVSFFLSRGGIARLSVERELPHAVHRGEAFGVVIRVTNARRLIPTVSVRVEFADKVGEAAGFFVSIPAGRTGQLRVVRQYDRRGVYQIPETILSTSFPFGLICARKKFTDNREILVYPRVLAARTAVIERTGGLGNIPRVFQGAGDEFFSLRDYVPGDDLRQIAWRVSAKSETLLVKELEQQTTRHVVFVLDSRRAPLLDDFEDRFEEAIELLASLAVTLLNRQYLVSAVTSTHVLGEGEGKAHALKLLEMLARLEPAESTEADPFPKAVSLSDARRVIFLMISPDPAMWGRVYSAGAVRVLDPREVIHA